MFDGVEVMIDHEELISINECWGSDERFRLPFSSESQW
jgi:hypothetical protein